jgi:hypothetical protein
MTGPVTNEQIAAYWAEMRRWAQAEMRRWATTPAGAAFTAFEHAYHDAIIADRNARIGDRRLREKWKTSDDAREKLIAAIKELQP